MCAKLSSSSPNSAPTLTKWGRADTKFGFSTTPPTPPTQPHPLHRKLFNIAKTILYWTYHIKTWQGAIYYYPNEYHMA